MYIYMCLFIHQKDYIYIRVYLCICISINIYIGIERERERSTFLLIQNHLFSSFSHYYMYSYNTYIYIGLTHTPLPSPHTLICECPREGFPWSYCKGFFWIFELFLLDTDDFAASVDLALEGRDEGDPFSVRK